MDKGMKKVVNLVTNYMFEFYENGICIRHR